MYFSWYVRILACAYLSLPHSLDRVCVKGFELSVRREKLGCKVRNSIK